MFLSRDRFGHLIPHAGSKGLIDRILEWYASTIRCSSSTHRWLDHPLSVQGRLHARYRFEYAAPELLAELRQVR